MQFVENIFPIAIKPRRGMNYNAIIRSGKLRQFTLVEVMIAFAVTAVMIAAAMGLLRTSLWAANFYSHRMAAVNIANSRIERLRALPYAGMPAMEEDNILVNARGVMDSDGSFTRTTVIGSEYHNSRSVTVTVGGLWKYDRPRVEVSVTSVLPDDRVMY